MVNMNCLRYWARYMCKEKVKDGGIKNGLIQTQSKLLQYTLKKNRDVLDKEGCSFWWSFRLEHFV